MSTYLCLPCVFSPCAPGPLFQFVFVTCVKHSSFFLVLVFLVFKSLHIFFLACLCPALLNFLPGCLPLSVPTWIFFIYWPVSVLCTWFQPSCVRFLSKTLIWKQKQMHFPLCCCHLQFHQGERWNYSPVVNRGQFECRCFILTSRRDDGEQGCDSLAGTQEKMISKASFHGLHKQYNAKNYSGNWVGNEWGIFQFYICLSYMWGQISTKRLRIVSVKGHSTLMQI